MNVPSNDTLRAQLAALQKLITRADKKPVDKLKAMFGIKD